MVGEKRKAVFRRLAMWIPLLSCQGMAFSLYWKTRSVGRVHGPGSKPIMNEMIRIEN